MSGRWFKVMVMVEPLLDRGQFRVYVFRVSGLSLTNSRFKTWHMEALQGCFKLIFQCSH